MTVTSVVRDPDALTMTVVAEFGASPERVWQLWADPRQLEGWWGPPNYPATFTQHDLAPGSRVEWHMTSPGGDRQHGYWDVLEAQPPRRLVIRDGFADDDGTPNADSPAVDLRITFDEIDQGRTRMTIETTFPSREAMEELLATGMAEGLAASVGQMDEVVADHATETRSRR